MSTKAWAIAAVVLVLGSLGSLSAFIIFTVQADKFDVGLLSNPSDTDLAVTSQSIVSDVQFEVASADCGIAETQSYQKCTSNDNTGTENCQPTPFCVIPLRNISSFQPTATAALALERCEDCSPELGRMKMAYSAGNRAVDEISCFFENIGRTDNPLFPGYQYAFCQPSFAELEEQAKARANLSLPFLIVLSSLGIVSIGIGAYKRHSERSTHIQPKNKITH